MFSKLLLLIGTSFLISFAQAQSACRQGFVTDPEDPDFGLDLAGRNCICVLDRIFLSEVQLTLPQTDTERTYTLCPQTTFEVGVATPEGLIDGGDFPIAIRRNAIVRCGESGESANGCIIDGTGSFGIFLSPIDTFLEADQGDVEFQGLTVDFFVTGGQVPIIMVFETGRVTFRDCIFSNIEADPFMAIDELDLSGGRRRSLTELGEFRGPFHYEQHSNHTSFLPPQGVKNNTADTTDNEIDDNAFTLRENGHRELQNSAYRIVFRGCKFEANSGVLNARSQAGLNIIRVRKALLSGFDADSLASADLRVIDCEFTDNQFQFDNDRAFYRGMIDFYSSGQLRVTGTTFANSGVKRIAPIVMQESSRLISNNNNLYPIQNTLECDFMARVDSAEYVVQSCESLGFVSQPPVTGGGFACFPGDAQVQLAGRGTVPMSSLQLGDQVMVESGNFEPIYSFGHLDQEVQGEFLKISTPAADIELTKDHMISLEGGRYVPASLIVVGDMLRLVGGELAECTGIEAVQNKGAYAPFTPSGTIVVNGIIASSFVAFQDSETLKIGALDTGIPYQHMAHAFEGPHRFYCSYVSKCISETYNAEGVSAWVVAPHSFYLWFLAQRQAVMLILAGPILLALALLAYPVVICATVALAIHGRRQALGLKVNKSPC